MPAFDGNATTDQVLSGLDLSRLRIVVTGSSGGLGEESVRAFASKGASITMAARNAEKNARASSGPAWVAM